MKTLLVLAQHPELPEAVRTGLNPDDYRVIHRMDVAEAEPLLGRSRIDLCLLDAEAGGVQGVWVIEKIRRQLPGCPIIVYVGARPWELEEEAYLLGISN